jgi:hypothetical protein
MLRLTVVGASYLGNEVIARACRPYAVPTSQVGGFLESMLDHYIPLLLDRVHRDSRKMRSAQNAL